MIDRDTADALDKLFIALYGKNSALRGAHVANALRDAARRIESGEELRRVVRRWYQARRATAVHLAGGSSPDMSAAYAEERAAHDELDRAAEDLCREDG